MLIDVQVENFFTSRISEAVESLKPREISVIERDFVDRSIKRSRHKHVCAVVIQMALFERAATDAVRLDVPHELLKLRKELRHFFRDLKSTFGQFVILIRFAGERLKRR